MSAKILQDSHDAYAALRYPEYRNFVAASFLFTIALLIQEVALGYEVYTMTHDPLALGLIGLAEALPFIGLSLYGGHIADRRSKRQIILWSVAIITMSSILLHAFARGATASAVSASVVVGIIYLTVFLIGLCRAFQSPAAASLRAFLVPIAAYENAATWSSSSWQAGSIVGPTIGGFLFAWLARPQGICERVQSQVRSKYPHEQTACLCHKRVETRHLQTLTLKKC